MVRGSSISHLYKRQLRTMKERERRVLHNIIESAWQDAKAAYQAAGAPFGTGRGLEIWIDYGQLTTVN